MREHKKSHLGIMGWAMFLAGAMSLGSCSSDETLESIEPKAITFGSVSMENLSRAAEDPSYNADNVIQSFQLFGTVNNVSIYNGVTVENKNPNDLTQAAGYNNVWYCPVNQYWIPDATYNFMAIVDGNKTIKDADNNDVVISSTTALNGMPTSITYNADGETDLLLSAPVTRVNNFSVVPFTFSHLLSKVHFTFDGAADIADIQITGHYASGTYTIGGENQGWDSQATTTSQLSFGGIDTDNNGTTSELARLIIPGEQEWTIKLYNSSGVQIGNDITLNYATAHNGVAATDGTTGFVFEPNTQYNINISIGEEMALSVSVQGWSEKPVPNDFANDVAVNDGGYITWANGTSLVYVNADGNQVGDDEEPVACHVLFYGEGDEATFTFTIAGPIGGTWHAMLVTKQGTSEVFDIYKVTTENGEVKEEKTNIGSVGEPCTLKIKTNSPYSGVANMAELRIVVQQGGEILPAHKLVTHTKYPSLNGHNYILVHNQ